MARVVVLGSSGYDLTIHLNRLPRPGETLLGGKLLRGPGGKGANAATAARRAGADVLFLTAFGDDDFGREIKKDALLEGIDISLALDAPGMANQVALILVDSAGENLIAVAPGASESLVPDYIASLPSCALAPPAVFLACLELPTVTVAAGLRRARKAGLQTVLNPAPADASILNPDVLGHVNILTPNQEEAALLSGRATDTIARAGDAGRALRDRCDCDVIITLGADGCLVLPRAGGSNLIPAPRVDVIDTVGAGDAFNGALSVALAEGKDLVEAASWATAAGAFAVTRAGARGALGTREEIERLMHESLCIPDVPPLNS
jgi:ribokinase